LYSRSWRLESSTKNAFKGVAAKRELTLLGLSTPIAALIVDLVREFRDELERQSVEVCAREVDVARGAHRGAAFVTAFERRVGPSDAIDTMQRTMEIDAKDVSEALRSNAVVT
jgi:hypothetical protein